MQSFLKSKSDVMLASININFFIKARCSKVFYKENSKFSINVDIKFEDFGHKDIDTFIHL